METFTGAYATPELVGREDILAKITEALQLPAKKPRVIFLTGKGGIGKTRLLIDILRRAGEIPGIRVANGLIDFYHMLAHTSDGLARALFEVLTPPIDDLRNYDHEYQALERRRLTGEVSRVTTAQREQTLITFSSDMSALTAKQRVVIALDTAEKIVYGTSRAEDRAESWIWLLGSLPSWGDVVIFIAGRPESALLGKELKNTLKENFIPIDVGKLEEAESLRYFDAAAKVARENHAKDIAERIEALPEETRRVAHIYADGQPILLALMIDNLSGGRPLPGMLLGTLEEAQRKTLEEKQIIQTELEKTLLERLREAPGGLGDTVLALGRVPKGADSEMLARLLEVSLAEAQAFLDKVKLFSFVKTRRKDDRIFLHDEMYAMLKHWVYDDPADGQQAEKAAVRIFDYYHDFQMTSIREEMDTLYAPVEEGRKNKLDFESLSILNAKRHAALVEQVYYRLRQNPAKGYMRFYRYVREATLSGDILLDTLLRIELAALLAERTEESLLEDGLPPDLLHWAVAARDVTQAWAAQEYERVIQEAQNVRQRHTDLFEANMPSSQAWLETWEAYALIYLGGEDSLKSAKSKLDSAVERMGSYLEGYLGDPSSDAKKWRSLAVLAFAYRVRGYLSRVRGYMDRAVEDYRQAARYFRQVNLRIELAATLNDMGFAMAELGLWADARALVSDALGLRRHLGPRAPVGLSLNTLAMIDLLEGNYESAIRNAESALDLFWALEDRRRAGLALTALAEAQRRFSGTFSDPEENVRLLREARDHARAAYEAFVEVGERYRQVEALIEEGCACRNWVNVRIKNPSARDDVRRLFIESRDALQRAADLAGDDVLYRKVDALVNLAWLGFFAGDNELLEEASTKAESSVGIDYKIEETGKPRIAKEEAHILIWPQLGKLRILHGHRAFAEYYGRQETGGKAERLKRADKLNAATSYYYWGLEYSSLFSSDYQRLRLAKDEIYENFRQLHDDELWQVAMVVENIEKKVGERSVMRGFLRHRALWYGGN